MTISGASTRTTELLELERKYCSFGDTVHYLDPPKVFVDCEGIYLYDEHGTPYLDLQMWYSAASFGYKNRRLGEALKRQLDRLPSLPASTCTRRRWKWRRASLNTAKNGSE